ncbi:hypothetical protein HBI56_074530 [Parastagonospora nodorum]|uniref:Uncharacterized protein n=1 Tax=Phaeosphaeria nodorum (strain SN15 / ATCC MYA-4574 / FGSC 10173) TaxID=321614 RepID=A0A7U2EWM8_PHANO|nr:hypothetical protein HBH56_170450 [Parastagonospora nodorum]QRC94450.1 hypothetical protein JI435_405830 [Parastagonospora nodorum SN15]KAH3928399.1 hypothetical protein HBH54_139010 [Parastagonospora nodorum]KAH3945495.1 hypothetical protein HBH53_144360 [Parastagonospora nodorum]KAH3983658.1 hypothetical protein HBH52_059860 [Parastagonospora nodorum]
MFTTRLDSASFLFSSRTRTESCSVHKLAAGFFHCALRQCFSSSPNKPRVNVR